MKHKYFKGQFITTKHLSDIKDRGAYPVFVPDMERFCGKIWKIKSPILSTKATLPIYNIEGWSWREDWLEDEFFSEKDFETIMFIKL